MKTPPTSPDPEQEGEKSWIRLSAAHSTFLNELECLSEMFGLISPVLKSEDEQREMRLQELTEEVESDGQRTTRRLKSIEHLREFSSHLKKIRKAEMMFRQGAITSIVAKFDHFLVSILEATFRQNTGWLKSADKKISYKELLEIESCSTWSRI